MALVQARRSDYNAPASICKLSGFSMLIEIDNKLVCRTAERTIVLESMDYPTRCDHLVRYGFRPAFAGVLADRTMDTDELLEFAVEFGLIER